MKMGTKSVLFGVHAFWFHPLVVALAWKHIYRRWPTISECIVIFCHDLGYWGKSAMDSPDGKTHPVAGAHIASHLVYFWCRLKFQSRATAMENGYRAFWLALYHSKYYADVNTEQVSELYLPDKACVLFEPNWFYLLRARASGEITEYVRNSPFGGKCVFADDFCPICEEDWLQWYRDKRAVDVSDFFLNRFAEYL